MNEQKRAAPWRLARSRFPRKQNPYLLIPIFLLPFLFGSCASPGEPSARKSPAPTAISDLMAEQQGNDVILTFTLPKNTVNRRPLKQTPEIEIYRDFRPVLAGSPSGSVPASMPAFAASLENPTLLYVIPSAMVDHFVAKDHVRYADSLQAADLEHHAGWIAVYIVRTRVSVKKSSADSNQAEVRIDPALNPIDDVKAEVTHTGIILTWTPPQKTPVGPAPLIAAYRIYRAEAEAKPDVNAAVKANGQPASPEVNDPENPKLKTPLAHIGDTPDASFRDMQVEFGKTYVYSVRSLTQYPGVTLESANSKLVIVTPLDTFPPTTPQDLIAVFVPAQDEAPAYFDLSWAISPETDIAGYNIYRSEQEGGPGARLNAELLLTPSFRDMNAVLGHRYYYSATAVDHVGNESATSAAVSASIPVEGQSNP